MHRLLAGLCVLSLVTLATADDKKPEAREGKGDTKPAAKENKAAAGLKKLETELLTKVRAAKTNEARKELFEAYAPRFLKLAEENKGDPVAVTALSYPLQMGPPHDARAITALGGYAKSAAIKDWVAYIASRPDPESQKLLRSIIDENPDKKLAARAVKAAIQGVERNAEIAKRLKSDEKLREQLAKFRGEDFVKSLFAQAKDADKLVEGYKKLQEDRFQGALPEVAVGKKVPDVVSQDLNGKPARLSDLKGKVVVLDVWATWCPPCKGMIPHSRDLVKKMKGKPFVFVSVSADAKKETLVNFLKETEMPWTHWWNGPSGGIVEEFDIEAFPTIYLIDAKGVLREKIVGADNKKIEEVAEKLVKEAEEGKDSSKKS